MRIEDGQVVVNEYSADGRVDDSVRVLLNKQRVMAIRTVVQDELQREKEASGEDKKHTCPYCTGPIANRASFVDINKAAYLTINESNQMYVDTDMGIFFLGAIKFCPICGRKLKG